MTGTIFDKLTAPPSAKLLGWRLISLDTAAGEIELGFDGKPEFLNPMGIVQGGFLSAMLDDTMGPLIFVMTEGRMFATTIDLHVHFLRPVKPGPITTKVDTARQEDRLCGRAALRQRWPSLGAGDMQRIAAGIHDAVAWVMARVG